MGGWCSLSAGSSIRGSRRGPETSRHIDLFGLRVSGRHKAAAVLPVKRRFALLDRLLEKVVVTFFKTVGKAQDLKAVAVAHRPDL
jgi:hypothetical protein